MLTTNYHYSCLHSNHRHNINAFLTQKNQKLYSSIGIQLIAEIYFINSLSYLILVVPFVYTSACFWNDGFFLCKVKNAVILKLLYTSTYFEMFWLLLDPVVNNRCLEYNIFDTDAWIVVYCVYCVHTTDCLHNNGNF